MTQDETHFNGFAGKVSFVIATAKDTSYIKFSAYEGFRASLTNNLKLADGRTVGQSEIDHMHAKLDEWINENLKDKK